MTSSSPHATSEEDTQIDIPANRSRQDIPVQLKEGLRQSIIARRRARGEKQLKIEFREPQEMELSSAEIEKKERRREQNRRAAQRCRNKKRVNQKSVVQNYEKVLELNRHLQQELETIKQELDGLKSACNYHSANCPSFNMVKSESKQIIKVEPITDEELEDTTQEDSTYTFEDSLNHGTFALTNSVFHYGGPQSLNSHKKMVSSYNDQGAENWPHLGLLQQHQPHASSADVNQKPACWYYSSSPAVHNHPTASCMFNESCTDICPVSILDESHCPSQKHLIHEQHEEQQKQKLRTEQNEYTKTVHEQELFQQYRSQPLAHSATIPSTYHSNPQNHQHPEQNRLHQPQNSTCQVVPSLRSPRPSSSTPRSSFSSDAIRHRSLSGGSVSASETSRSCIGEKRFTSVSSEGSVYVDNQGSMYQELRTLEVHDIDSDDVFVVPESDGGMPLDGHDTNNNLEAMPDNNRVTESDVIQFIENHLLYTSSNISRDERTTDPSTISMMEAEEVSSLLQIDDLRLFSAFENNEQDFDALNQILFDTRRVDC